MNITPEQEERIKRRLEFAKQDGNQMRANTQYSQYIQDVELLLQVHTSPIQLEKPL